ncbi:DEAD-domain-containing protein [Aspergillus heteromorphus CBS 117.55]|uniref:ATP-dependent RNA helicase n=1 Tax=Aspergillus heteromorphus CBS 117.55 TaxID=1448321 RepID=A0A317W0X7_9EURO|nr:DEAD-domain-containing protein [Aspergillus heteromorphus CBS 117.55]PWY79251.1 DEAD-domain-containing protein [Aspergillus heteromorphus CBS 117.55]
MLGAFRRFGVAHALRASSRPLLARTTPQHAQSLAPSAPAISLTARALYHPTPARFQQLEAELKENDEAESNGPVPFADLETQGLLNASIVNVITKKMKITHMTDVQSQTIRDCLKGDDVLAQAKTGTGKTLAFLTPVIQNILQCPDLQLASAARMRRAASSDDIRAIIISPTRELAEQISVEAKRLTESSGLVVQTAVGGTNKREHLQRTRREGCHILVGTPGRLKDLLSDPYSGIKAPNLTSLVFDEADRLLDSGFFQEIQEIQELLPDPTKVDRQTLMFSATVPDEVMDVVRMTMKPDFKFIKTVRDDEAPTHLRVPQKVVYLDGFQNGLPAILELVQTHLEETDKPFKGIIYFNSTLHTSLSWKIFRRLHSDPDSPRSKHPLGTIPLFEIHGRLTQAQRTTVTDRFRRCQDGILFSSDVTARGLDFPDVTHVIQLGLPRERQSYIHRVGRTGRAGKEGEGWIFVHKGEMAAFKKMLRDLPIEEINTNVAAQTIMGEDLDETSPLAFRQVKASAEWVDTDLKVDAWKAFANTISPQFYPPGEGAVEALNEFATAGLGLRTPPQLPSMVQQVLMNGARRQQNTRRSGGYGSFNRGGGRDNYGRSNFGGGRGRSDYGRDNYGGRDDFGRGGGRYDRRGSQHGYGGRGRQGQRNNYSLF